MEGKEAVLLGDVKLHRRFKRNVTWRSFSYEDIMYIPAVSRGLKSSFNSPSVSCL